MVLRDFFSNVNRENVKVVVKYRYFIWNWRPFKNGFIDLLVNIYISIKIYIAVSLKLKVRGKIKSFHLRKYYTHDLYLYGRLLF